METTSTYKSRCSPIHLLLGYTSDDDGVHLTCRNCGHDTNLGFDANSFDFANAMQEHLGGP